MVVVVVLGEAAAKAKEDIMTATGVTTTSEVDTSKAMVVDQFGTTLVPVDDRHPTVKIVEKKF